MQCSAIIVVLLSLACLPTLALSSEARCPSLHLEDPHDARTLARYRAEANKAPRLFRAIQKDDLRAVKRYLARGDDPDACALGASLVAHAAGKGTIEVVDTLLSAGASLDRPVNAAGETAMLHAVGEGRFMRALQLVERGANIKASIEGGGTALHVAAAIPVDRFTTSERQQLDFVRALLVHGHGANVQTTEGGTALMLAANLGNAILVKQLLSYGADANLKNAGGQSALQVARAIQREDIATSLREAGAQDVPGTTSLAQLIEQHRSAELVQALSQQASGAAPFRYKQGLLVTAILARSPQAIGQLVRWGVDPNAVFETQEGFDSAVYTPLLFAVGYDSDVAMLQSLLEAGTNPNLYVQPRELDPPLLFALSRQNLAVAEILLKYGADPNLASPSSGMTPLMSAVLLTGLPKPVRALNLIVSLLAAGAQTNVREEHGLTALHWAAMGGYTEIIRLLLEYSADPNALDNDNRTPLFHARQSKAPGAIALLAPITKQFKTTKSRRTP